jgi:hypothetical protein
MVLVLTFAAMSYFFWPRRQMGPPVFVQNLVHDRYLPAIEEAQDSLLDEALNSQHTDSLLAAIPDSTLQWMKARVYRSWLHLEKKAAGQARIFLEGPLPDSNWQWIPSRHWYLALARTQTGKLSEALRVLDSVPSSFNPDKERLIHILQTELEEARPREEK